MNDFRICRIKAIPGLMIHQERNFGNPISKTWALFFCHATAVEMIKSVRFDIPSER